MTITQISLTGFMSAIVILTGAHLCCNPRVIKEATALADAGHDVTVLGPILSDELRTKDADLIEKVTWRYLASCDLRGSHAGAWKRFRLKLDRRLGAEAVRWLGWQLPNCLGYGAARLLDAARQNTCDLFIGHLEAGAWVACQLARQGRRVGADFEDWYSRDLLPTAQRYRPIRLLSACEAFLVRFGAHVTTTSHALARGLAETYGGPLPRVIYNAFSWNDRFQLGSLSRDERGYRPSLHWFSQSIGPGRGLEILCNAMALVDRPTEVHLRGGHDASTTAWIRGLFPLNRGHKLYLHDIVPQKELIGRIASHDIGLAPERCAPDSRNLTVTNKILHYLLAGLAVVASDTLGQKEIAQNVKHGIRLFRAGDPESLAAQLNMLLRSDTELDRSKRASLEAAQRHYCWERQIPVLLESVQFALRRRAIMVGSCSY